MSNEPGEITSPDDKFPRELFPRVILVLWAIWFLYQLNSLILNPAFRSADKTLFHWTYISATVFGTLGFIGITGWLAYRLFRRPRTVTAVWFIILSLLLLWKFCIANIFAFMSPKMGEHTLFESIALWWSFVTSHPLRTVEQLFYPIFILICLVYWPFYCGKRKLPAPPSPIPSTPVST
jgi:hypothetical protein